MASHLTVFSNSVTVFKAGTPWQGRNNGSKVVAKDLQGIRPPEKEVGPDGTARASEQISHEYVRYCGGLMYDCLLKYTCVGPAGFLRM